ncbi:hypothetical protein J6T21_01290, partial [Candidatus Saccharibacteria bacterium]|nr:hypothetical protein [Candidatus Saccharibacteria bacterium]
MKPNGTEGFISSESPNRNMGHSAISSFFNGDPEKKVEQNDNKPDENKKQPDENVRQNNDEAEQAEPLNTENNKVVMTYDAPPKKPRDPAYQMLESDFTDPEVMRSFADAAASETGIFFMSTCYNSPNVLKALHDPIFQDAIISAISEKQKSDQPYQGKAIPSLLLALVGDHAVVNEMQARRAFDRLPKINPYVNYTISRIKQGKTTDRDIVLLFDEYTAMDDLLFNFDNSLTPLGIKQAINAFVPITALDVKEDFWQYCLNERDFRLIVDQDSATKAKINIEKPLMDFVEGVEGHVFKEDKTVTEDNIIAALGRFITEESEDWDYSLGDDFRIKEAFQHNKIKNLALTKLRQIYLNYLKKSDYSSFPRSLQIMSDYTRERRGAGPLTQIESFLSYTGELSRADPKCRELSKSFENKMTEAHWSNQEKTNFYNISAEMLHASSEIYKSFANVLLNLPDKNDFEIFTQEIFPLFRAKLAILAKYEEKESKDGKKYIATNYDAGDIISITEQLHNALAP